MPIVAHLSITEVEGHHPKIWTAPERFRAALEAWRGLANSSDTRKRRVYNAISRGARGGTSLNGIVPLGVGDQGEERIMLDLLIKNGRVIDGSGQAAFYADVAVILGNVRHPIAATTSSTCKFCRSAAPFFRR